MAKNPRNWPVLWGACSFGLLLCTHGQAQQTPSRQGALKRLETLQQQVTEQGLQIERLRQQVAEQEIRYTQQQQQLQTLARQEDAGNAPVATAPPDVNQAGLANAPPDGSTQAIRVGISPRPKKHSRPWHSCSTSLAS